MDDLISKLRNQSSQKKAVKDDTNDLDKAQALVPNETKDAFEVTTSQSEVLQQSRFKLDFDFLLKNRVGEYITISEIRCSELYKINVPFWAIVKSIESFKGIKNSVYRWELCDDTGSIFGSSIVDDTKVKVGNIVCLNDFSLWKVDGNHINIVDGNVKKIID